MNRFALQALLYVLGRAALPSPAMWAIRGAAKPAAAAGSGGALAITASAADSSAAAVAIVPKGKAASEPKRTRHGQKTTPGTRTLTEEVQAEAVPLLLKGFIKHSRMLRTHQALLVDTAVGDGAIPWVLAVRAAGNAYHEATVGQAGHGLGSPSQYLWSAFVAAILEEAQGEALGKDTILRAPPSEDMAPLWEVYRSHLFAPDPLEDPAVATRRALANMLFFEPLVQHFKVEDLREEQVRIMFHLDHPQLHAATKAALVWSTFSLKLGPDRPDFLERDASRLLGGKGRGKGKGKKT